AIGDFPGADNRSVGLGGRLRFAGAVGLGNGWDLGRILLGFLERLGFGFGGLLCFFLGPLLLRGLGFLGFLLEAALFCLGESLGFLLRLRLGGKLALLLTKLLAGFLGRSLFAGTTGLGLGLQFRLGGQGRRGDRVRDRRGWSVRVG